MIDYNDYTLYYFLAFILFVLSLIVQAWLNHVVKKYSEEYLESHMTANDVCNRMLYENDVDGIVIMQANGNMTDCYSPKEGVIYLSKTSYHNPTVAAVAIAAHECGHACQDNDNMIIYRIRHLLAPVAGFCARGALWLATLGILLAAVFEVDSYISTSVFNLGIFIYLGAFLFYLVMFPVEIDASRRGMRFLKETGWLNESQLRGARHVLVAAGSTYFIALANAGLTLMRLVLLRNRNTKRR